MKTYKIAVIAGDGIGKEVVPAGMQVLNMSAEQDGFRCEFTELPWGCDFYLKTGRMIDPDGVDQVIVAKPWQSNSMKEPYYQYGVEFDASRANPSSSRVGRF